MQTGLVVGDGVITGTLNKLTSGQLVTDWGEGYFMALKFENPDPATTSLKVGMDPSQSSGLVELDEDMNGVFKVTDNDVQIFVTVSKRGEEEKRIEYDLSGLVLNE